MSLLRSYFVRKYLFVNVWSDGGVDVAIKSGGWTKPPSNYTAVEIRGSNSIPLFYVIVITYSGPNRMVVWLMYFSKRGPWGKGV